MSSHSTHVSRAYYRATCVVNGVYHVIPRVKYAVFITHTDATRACTLFDQLPCNYVVLETVAM